MAKLELGLWKATSKKGEYFFKIDDESGKKVVLFKNKSDHPKSPSFNIIIQDIDENGKPIEDDKDDGNFEDVEDVEDDLPF